MAIAKEIRQLARASAKYLCEYCHSSEEASAAQFEIDHIQPRSLGGDDTLENLVLISLFNPRLNQWDEHFI